MRLSVCLGLLLAGVTLVGIFVGRPIWAQYQMQRRVDRIVAGLEQREEPPIDADLLTSLETDRRYGPELQLLRGVQLLRSGEPAQALKMFGLVKPNGKLRIPLLLHVGQALYQVGQLTQSEQVFHQVAFEKPEVSRAHRWLVTIHHDLGAMQSAFAELQKVATLEPDDFFAYRLMGLMYLEDFQKPQEAVVEYRKALARNPPAPQAQAIRCETARALIFLNDYQGALEVLDEAEKDTLVLGLQADCRWSMSETDEAVRLLEQARSLNPNERIVQFLTGRFALEEGRPAAALEPFEKILERDPHDVQTRYQLSQAHRQLGDQRAAAAELERMNESKALTEKLGPLYEQAMLRPADAEIRDELAGVCDKLGKRELARVWRRAASQVRQSAGISAPVR